MEAGSISRATPQASSIHTDPAPSRDRRPLGSVAFSPGASRSNGRDVQAKRRRRRHQPRRPPLAKIRSGRRRLPAELLGWLTCLEMERDVRKMKREDQFGTGPDTGSYTLPKVRPAINEGGTVSAGVLEARANDSAQRASKPVRASTYIPPAVSNPSAQINQLNQSFQFNRGLGNNPTGRDSFIRYNLTR
jgi:hypothetical protein